MSCWNTRCCDRPRAERATPLPPLTLVLEGSDGCELELAGPAGRPGLSVVRAVRLGPSMFQVTVPEPGSYFAQARCAGRPRQVVPSEVRVPPGVDPLSIRLVWK